VALAVLDVIEQQELLANARQMGELLQQGLRSLASRHPALGEVRGAGLFIGVQVESREATTRIVNALRRAGVLIGSAGRNADVLKIRPPLTIAAPEVELLLETLDRVLLYGANAATAP
jgi:4-aminobutyrate aminotransferase-like enzyme